MSFSSSGRLPVERASKLGHLPIVESEWVRSLIAGFEAAPEKDHDLSNTMWSRVDFDEDSHPLTAVWAVDGSFAPVKTSDTKSPREVGFVKTALMIVDKTKLDKIDKDQPHPLLLRDVLSDSAVFHATVLPLKNVKTKLGTNYDAVRHIIYDSIRLDQDGMFYDTLKWIAFQKWNGEPQNSPSFACPHCDHELETGFAPDKDTMICSNWDCEGEILLTDMIGFHLDMDDESAPDSVASSYMAIMEHLMLFTAIRLLWTHSDRSLLSETLFIKDGPLTLRAQYSKLVPGIRAFFEHAKKVGRTVHVIGQEKSGAFYDHLQNISRFASPKEKGEPASFSVLSHDYVRREVHRSPNKKNPYGKRTNWGEKVLVKLEPACALVINIPTGLYKDEDEFPATPDVIGLKRILATLPSLVSHRFEGALYPIELANGIASLSSYPSAKILQRFVENR